MYMYRYIYIYPACPRPILDRSLKKDLFLEVLGPIRLQGRVLQGFKMCTAKRHIILCTMFTSLHEEKQSRIKDISHDGSMYGRMVYMLT